MKRLLLLSLVCVLTASTCGCSSSPSGWFSGCRLFSGYRGDPCGACAAPNPCGCATPVYSQSIPAYGGYGGFSGCSSCPSCDDCGGFGGCADGCCGGAFPGMQMTPGTLIPGQGMIIDGAQQIPVLPGPATTPRTLPVPQTMPGPAQGT